MGEQEYYEGAENDSPVKEDVRSFVGSDDMEVQDVLTVPDTKVAQIVDPA